MTRKHWLGSVVLRIYKGEVQGDTVGGGGEGKIQERSWGDPGEI